MILFSWSFLLFDISDFILNVCCSARACLKKKSIFKELLQSAFYCSFLKIALSFKKLFLMENMKNKRDGQTAEPKLIFCLRTLSKKRFKKEDL